MWSAYCIKAVFQIIAVGYIIEAFQLPYKIGIIFILFFL